MTTPTLPDPWPPEAREGTVAERKAACRTWVRAERRRRREEGGEPARREAAARLREHATGWLAARRGDSLAGLVVTSYEPFPTEPDVSDLNATLQRERATVLVPVTLGLGQQLQWCDLADPDRTHLGLESLGRVDVVLLPGLAVTGSGVRLGQGGGFYDMLAPHLPAGAPRVVVLHDHEVVAWLPAEPHDIVVSHALTPGGLRALG